MTVGYRLQRHCREDSRDRPPNQLEKAKSIIDQLSDDDLKHPVFDDVHAGARILQIAHGLPPNFHPDLTFGSEEFMEARKKCNAEMLRRCTVLCTAKVRKDISQNADDFCPCTMRSQCAEYGTQDESLPTMMRKVAASIADPGQAHMEVDAAIPESKPASSRATSALAPKRAADSNQALKFTLEDLNDFHAQRLHQSRGLKPIEWALDEKTPREDDPPALRHRPQGHRKAMGEIIGQKTKGGKGGKKKLPANILTVFKEKVDNLGLEFDGSKIGSPRQQPRMALLAAARRGPIRAAASLCFTPIARASSDEELCGPGWISSVPLPSRAHVDIDRAGAAIDLIEESPQRAPFTPVGGSGADGRIPPRIHDRRVALSLDDIECQISHHPETGLFLPGALVGKAVDASVTFAGVDLAPQLDGAARARPSTESLGAGSARAPVFGRAPTSMKRGLALGAVARMRDYTRPVDSMAE
ncbi:unnamed protein product, partial [Prorocentrum cordatum]